MAVIAVLLLWISIDLFVPHRVDIRQFDPAVVGHLDAVMWRSYYDRKPVRLFLQLAELLREQYGFPLLKSHVVAYRAAKAAFVFKEGGSRADYEKALPDLTRYYQEIRAVSRTPFELERNARLELEWWIVHRQRDRFPPGALERALAEAAAALYNVAPDGLMEYARLRTEAMTIRDTKAAAGTLREDDWQRIEQLLQQCWQSLWGVVNSQ